MRSEIRIFRDSGKGARGNILPRALFNLFRDIEEKKIIPECGEYFVSEAEKMKEEPIPLLPLSLYRDKFLTGVRSRFEKIHHRRRDMLLYTSLAEAYERKGRFVERICDLVWAILEETSWVIPAHYYHSPTNPLTDIPEYADGERLPGLDLYAANCCATLATVEYLLKDELDAVSPEICRRINRQIYLRGTRPFINGTYSWMGEGVGSFIDNWLTNITSNILFAAAVTEEDTAVRTRVCEKAMRFLDNFTASYPEDGCCDEGPGYWGAAAGSLFDCLEIIEDMSDGKIEVYSHPLVRRMGEYIMNVNIDGNYYVNFADARPRLEHAGKRIARYGEKCASPALRAFGEAVAEANPINTYYFFGMCYRVLKDAMTRGVRNKQKPAPQKFVWYEGHKVAVLRESEDTKCGFFLATKGGTNGEMHNHNDVGCLVVFHGGRPVIVDPSHGSYDNDFFGKSRYGRWFMKSSYHSIPTVGGIEQAPGAQYRSTDEQIDPENMQVSMDLASAFPKEAGIISMRRTSSLRDSTVTVTDEVKLCRIDTIAFHYLTVDEPKPIADGTLALAEGCIFSYDGEGLTLTVEKAENTWLPYDDLNIPSTWDRDCLWRIVLTAKGTEAKVTARISHP